MQSNLLKLEDKLYNEIQQESKDEAVKVALFLASHPAPPMPDFPLDKAYNDNEKLADAIDDIFGKEKEEVQDFMNDNYEEKSSSKKETITDSEAIKICNEWKVTYKVLKYFLKKKLL